MFFRGKDLVTIQKAVPIDVIGIAVGERRQKNLQPDDANLDRRIVMPGTRGNTAFAGKKRYTDRRDGINDEQQ